MLFCSGVVISSRMAPTLPKSTPGSTGSEPCSTKSSNDRFKGTPIEPTGTAAVPLDQLSESVKTSTVTVAPALLSTDAKKLTPGARRSRTPLFQILAQSSVIDKIPIVRKIERVTQVSTRAPIPDNGRSARVCNGTVRQLVGSNGHCKLARASNQVSNHVARATNNRSCGLPSDKIVIWVRRTAASIDRFIYRPIINDDLRTR